MIKGYNTHDTRNVYSLEQFLLFFLLLERARGWPEINYYIQLMSKFWKHSLFYSLLYMLHFFKSYL